MSVDELFFPGRDYPDREVWLAKRTTPHNLLRTRVARIIYQGKKPLRFGSNAAKRAITDPQMRKELLQQRRDFYLRTAPDGNA